MPLYFGIPEETPFFVSSAAQEPEVPLGPTLSLGGRSSIW